MMLQKAVSMAYEEAVEKIPMKKREKLSAKLIDLILKSKNVDKMPSSLAKTILHRWQLGPLTNKTGLMAVLEAAVVLESEKTMDLLEEELQLMDVVKAIKAAE
jgi:hypothetical protein